MVEHAAPPREAVAAAEAACGGRVELTPVSDRRGSSVFRASGPNGVVALKAGTGPGAATTAREAEALRHLHWDGYLLGAGLLDGISWMVTRWFDAPSAYALFEPVRQGRGPGRAREAAVAFCQAVGELHASGWVHGDLQAAHALHTDDGVKLIDLAWARRDGFEVPVTFKGGLVHLLAPELAAQATAGADRLLVTPEAEVYSLAGALWTSVTGAWPLDYAAVGIERTTVTPDRLRAVIAHGVPLTGIVRCRALQDVLRRVLLSHPADRPTAGELGVEVAALGSSRS
ncbi:hypothetical protein [Streptomyces sp. NPDC059708]|uniref:hypothetical protein n=1 Tax=Streptomyces sp. NPDC059708 TaxID=3346916 RepID=UPI00368B4DC1